MKKIVLLIVLLFLGRDKSTKKIPFIQNEIQSILDQQKQSWNEGNIQGFMTYYWHSEDFTFQSDNKWLQGWDELLAMYQKNYSGANMGKLDLTDVKINVLSKEIAYVLGR